MQDRVTFPDFSAFQVDIPAHAPSGNPCVLHAWEDLRTAFRPEFLAADPNLSGAGSKELPSGPSQES